MEVASPPLARGDAVELAGRYSGNLDAGGSKDTRGLYAMSGHSRHNSRETLKGFLPRKDRVGNELGHLNFPSLCREKMR
jgi:hypothetical protein